VHSQVHDMIDLLASRPSIALWSMHNEPPWTPTGEFLGGDVHQARTNEAVDTEAAALARRLDPTRPATAASGLHDQHLYHGWYTGTWVDNRGLAPPFPTEFGVQALPNQESPVWEGLNTDWPVSGSDASWAHAGYQSVFWASPGVGPPSKFATLAGYIRAGQEYQAFFIRHSIDQWRRQKFSPVGGYIHFLFTDGWPGITWSVLDYHRLPKLGYAALAEASRPVRLCIDPHDNFHVEDGFRIVYPENGEMRITLHLVNDDYRQRGQVRVKWRLERQGRTALGRLLNRVVRVLRQEGTTVDLPAADAGALPIGSLTVPLRNAGDYVLHTEVVGAAGVLDYNSLRFRVGEPRPRQRISRALPGWLVSKIYKARSLRRAGDGVAFTLRNPAMPVALEGLGNMTLDGAPLPAEQVLLAAGGESRPASALSADAPFEVASGQELQLVVRGVTLDAGQHEFEITVRAKGLGEISARVRDRLE